MTDDTKLRELRDEHGYPGARARPDFKGTGNRPRGQGNSQRARAFERYTERLEQELLRLEDCLQRAHDELHIACEKTPTGALLCAVHDALHEAAKLESFPLADPDYQPTKHNIARFERRFRKACSRSEVAAAFLAMVPDPKQGPGAMTLVSGGAAQVCQLLDTFVAAGLREQQRQSSIVIASKMPPLNS